MKLTTFDDGAGPRLGALIGDRIADLTSAGLPVTMLGYIQAGPTAWQQAASVLQTASLRWVDAAQARLLAPLPNPGKIVAIGLNYMDHCREQNIPAPDRPLVFTKFNSAITGPDQPISWDPEVTNQVDYEVELGVIIGQTARRVEASQALEHVFGYTIVNDISARDVQFSDRQWVRAKSMDTFCPMGPVIVTADEIPDPQALHIVCRVNQVALQDSSTAEMVFNVRELISRLSHSFTFEPGDLISTGTPDGVGVFRKPQIFLKPGDTVDCEIEKIGLLKNWIKG